ncbi:hypothetical protein HDU98_004613, partial [Podochytrium sp. JEL0797]
MQINDCPAITNMAPEDSHGALIASNVPPETAERAQLERTPAAGPATPPNLSSATAESSSGQPLPSDSSLRLASVETQETDPGVSIDPLQFILQFIDEYANDDESHPLPPGPPPSVSSPPVVLSADSPSIGSVADEVSNNPQTQRGGRARGARAAFVGPVVVSEYSQLKEDDAFGCKRDRYGHLHPLLPDGNIKYQLLSMNKPENWYNSYIGLRRKQTDRDPERPGWELCRYVCDGAIECTMCSYVGRAFTTKANNEKEILKKCPHKLCPSASNDDLSLVYRSCQAKAVLEQFPCDSNGQSLFKYQHWSLHSHQQPPKITSRIAETDRAQLVELLDAHPRAGAKTLKHSTHNPSKAVGNIHQHFENSGTLNYEKAKHKNAKSGRIANAPSQFHQQIKALLLEFPGTKFVTGFDYIVVIPEHGRKVLVDVGRGNLPGYDVGLNTDITNGFFLGGGKLQVCVSYSPDARGWVIVAFSWLAHEGAAIEGHLFKALGAKCAVVEGFKEDILAKAKLHGIAVNLAEIQEQQTAQDERIALQTRLFALPSIPTEKEFQQEMKDILKNYAWMGPCAEAKSRMKQNETDNSVESANARIFRLCNGGNHDVFDGVTKMLIISKQDRKEEELRVAGHKTMYGIAGTRHDQNPYEMK